MEEASQNIRDKQHEVDSARSQLHQAEEQADRDEVEFLSSQIAMLQRASLRIAKIGSKSLETRATASSGSIEGGDEGSMAEDKAWAMFSEGKDFLPRSEGLAEPREVAERWTPALLPASNASSRP